MTNDEALRNANPEIGFKRDSLNRDTPSSARNVDPDSQIADSFQPTRTMHLQGAVGSQLSTDRRHESDAMTNRLPLLDKMLLRTIVVTAVLLFSAEAFVPSSSLRFSRRSALASSLHEPPPSPDAMRHDIEEMRAEALRRLEKLNLEMQAIKSEHAQRAPPELVATDKIKAEKPRQTTTPELHSLDSLEGDLTKQVQTVDEPVVEINDVIRPSRSDPKRYDLLDDTRWKIVFNVGREAGTWMPKEWGNSGDRCLFEVVVDLTADPSYERDDFFQGVAGMKELDVVDAWVFPAGVGADSIGRRPIKVQPTGAYKVIPGQGPMGTDIVRLFIELEEEVQQKPGSDVCCPKGRVYATCGYFPIRQHKGTAWKDILAEKQRAVAQKYEELQRQADADSRLFSLEQLSRMKELYQVRRELESINKELQEARQRDPERSQLRLSRRGDVGLSREGGICCKVHKGMAVEYHILGRMEVASIQKHEEHDQYEELVHELHP